MSDVSELYREMNAAIIRHEQEMWADILRQERGGFWRRLKRWLGRV